MPVDISDTVENVLEKIASYNDRMILRAGISMIVARTTNVWDDALHNAVIKAADYLSQHQEEIPAWGRRIEDLWNQNFTSGEEESLTSMGFGTECPNGATIIEQRMLEAVQTADDGEGPGSSQE